MWIHALHNQLGKKMKFSSVVFACVLLLIVSFCSVLYLAEQTETSDPVAADFRCENCSLNSEQDANKTKKDGKQTSQLYLTLYFLLVVLSGSFVENAEQNQRELAGLHAVLAAFVMTSIICVMSAGAYIWLSKCHSRANHEVYMKDKTQGYKVAKTYPFNDTEDEQWVVTSKLVQLRKLHKDALVTKQTKEQSFFQDLEPFISFPRQRQFPQMLTVCPAEVNLVSHFASGTYGHPGGTQELQKEGVRLASFKNFPTSTPVSALRLAQAGFFSTGERDQVKCFSCGVTYQGWQLGDRPTLIHARISPSCALVRGTDSTNLPLPSPVSSRPDFSETSSMDSGFFGSLAPAAPRAGAAANSAGHELQEDSAPSTVSDSKGRVSTSLGAAAPQVAAAAASVPIPSSLATMENSMFSGAPLFGRATDLDGGAPRNQTLPTRRLELSGAVYPLYSQKEARERSYSGWPGTEGLPEKQELIILGFFYAGYADCVRCFYCGIGLKSWEAGDDPSEVHARWRPTCEYLRLVKGDEFVDVVANGGRNVANNSMGSLQTK